MSALTMAFIIIGVFVLGNVWFWRSLPKVSE